VIKLNRFRIVGFALLSGLLLGIFQVPSSASAKGDSAAIENLSTCLASGGHGRILLMLDTSGSLKQSDKENRRIAAATYFVNDLVGSLARSGAEIDIAVAGFSTDFDVALGWTKLSDANEPKIARSISDFRSKNRGLETDYWNALNGARKYLGKNANDNTCKVLVWFSDGAHDIEPRSSARLQEKYGKSKPYGPKIDILDERAARRVEENGLNDLCRDGGVTDQIRADGIITLAIGLKGNLKSADFDVMRGVATSSEVAGSPCGSIPGSGRGLFVLAQDLSSLIFAFDSLSDPNHLPLSTESAFCQGSVCSDHAHPFVLDSTISRVKILGGSDLRDFYAVLVTPSGERIRIEPKQTLSMSGTSFTLAGEWRDDTVFSLVLDRKSDSGWIGEWQLIFVDPKSTNRGKARSNIRLYTDLEPVWIEPVTTFISGESPKVTFDVMRDGQPFLESGTKTGTVSINPRIAFENGDELKIAAKPGQPVVVNLNKAPSGKATVLVNLNLQTKGADGAAGSKLKPVTKAYPIVIEPPANYPRLASTIDFGSSENTEPLVATLPVDGSGCVWLANSKSTTLPEGVDSVEITTDASDESKCQTGDLELTLTPGAVGNGLVSGQLTIMAKPAQGTGEPLPSIVKYQLEMQRPANKAIRWTVFIFCMVLGVLLPLLLLVWIKWFTAKIPGRALTWVSVDGDVDLNGTFLDSNPPDPTQLRTVRLDGLNRRHLQLGSAVGLHSDFNPRNLSSSGRIKVDAKYLVTSTGETLPLAVQNKWIAILSESNPHTGPVQIVFVLSEGGAKLEEVVAQARVELPDAVSRVRSRITNHPVQSEAQGGWGSSNDGSGSFEDSNGSSW